MPRPHVRPVNVNDYQGQPSRGIIKKVLSLDPDTGAITMYYSIPAGWKGTRGVHYHSGAEEVLILDGDVILDDVYRFTSGCYLYRPGGIAHGNIERSERGCQGIFMFEREVDFLSPDSLPGGKYTGEFPVYEAQDGRGHIKFLDTNEMEWQESPLGLKHKTLSYNPIDGSTTSLISLPPGWKSCGPHFHNHLEEGFVVRGTITSSAATSYLPGTYACRPPQIVHGAGETSSEGALVLLKRHGFYDLVRLEDVPQGKRDALIWE